MRLLVVQHDEGVAAVICAAIQSRGHQPLLVRNATAAAGAIERKPPDGILVDVSLPDMSGLAFLQLPVVRDTGIPIVIAGSLISEAQARECLRLGAVDAVADAAAVELLQHVIAYLEVRARQSQREQPEPGSERRRAPRATIAAPIQVFDSVEWQGVTVNVSTFGVKIKPARPVTPGPSVRVQFTLPDDDEPLFVLAQYVRTDGDEHVYRFVNLSPTEFRRLDTLVEQLKSD